MTDKTTEHEFLAALYDLANLPVPDTLEPGADAEYRVLVERRLGAVRAYVGAMLDRKEGIAKYDAGILRGYLDTYPVTYRVWEEEGR